MTEIKVQNESPRWQKREPRFERAYPDIAAKLRASDPNVLRFVAIMWETGQNAQEGLLADISGLQSKLKQAERQLTEALIDPVTKLPRREQFYYQLKTELAKALNLSQITSDQAFAPQLETIFNNLKPEIIQRIPLTVMMADVAFLSLANKFGHAQGDQFLFDLGQVARNLSLEQLNDPVASVRPKFSAFRHGGDELTGLIREADQQQVATLIDQFKTNVGGLTVETFTKFDLRATIDVGTATFTEAIEGFKIFLAESQRVGLAVEYDNVGYFIDFWLEIADRRAGIAKGVRRIKMLIELKKRDPDQHKKLSAYTRKGAYDTTDEELDYLDSLRDQDNWDQLIFNHILKKIEQDRSEKVEIEYKRIEIINQIADRIFQ